MRRILVAGHAEVGLFLALFVKEQGGRRAEELEALQQGFVVCVVGGDIGLQQYSVLQFGLHGRIAESKAFHLLARHAPVGVEIQHHGLAVGLGDARIQFCALLTRSKRRVDGVFGGSVHDIAERAQDVARAGQRADEIGHAQQQGENADAFAKFAHAMGVMRQRVERMQIDRR